MSRTLTVSDALYGRLESAAQRHGLATIEDLLELWQARADELSQRRQVVQQTNALRERLLSAYGEMPDSTALLREDRER